MSTEYGKIDTLFERDMADGSPTKGKLLEPLRFKNPTYEQFAKLQWTEKVDGMNIRVDWAPEHSTFGDINGPNETVWPESLRYGGKTDKAHLPGPLTAWLTEHLNAETMKKRFATAKVTMYGEGYGAGIQKGGGYREGQAFILFDVFVHDDKGLPQLVSPSGADAHWMRGWWMPHDMLLEVGAILDIEVTPLIVECSIMEAAELVRPGMLSEVAKRRGGTVQSEGLVGRPAHTMYNSHGGRIIVKLKTNDFVGAK